MDVRLTSEDILKRKFNVACVECGGFDEWKIILACGRSAIVTRHGSCKHTRELLCFFCRHSTEMPQIALVAYQHDHDIGICMVAKFFQPSGNIIVGLMFADIIDQKRSHCPPVICWCDSAIPLPVQQYPRSAPWSFSYLPESTVWQIRRLSSTSNPDWTHSEWSGSTGLTFRLQNLRSGRLFWVWAIFTGCVDPVPFVPLKRNYHWCELTKFRECSGEYDLHRTHHLPCWRTGDSMQSSQQTAL